MSCEAWPCTAWARTPHPPTQVPDTQLQYNCFHGSGYLKYPITEKSAVGRILCSWEKTSLLFSCDYLTYTLRWILQIIGIVSLIIMHIVPENYIYSNNMAKKRFMIQTFWESCCIYSKEISASSGKNWFFYPTQPEVWVFYTTGWKNHPCCTCWTLQSNLNTAWMRLPCTHNQEQFF